MKKLLAMVLALVMTLSLAVSASAFKDDKDINDTYAEAAAVLDGMGVFEGVDGSFLPKDNITRAQVAAIIYRVATTDTAGYGKDKSGLYASYNKFSDMTGAGWASGYIGYTANAGYVKGYPDGTFKPSGNVTGYEVLAMILRAVGYDKNNEFTGADWALHVAQTAQEAGILTNIKGVDLNAVASRELVAEMLFRAIAKAPMVTYTPAFGYVTDKVLKSESTLGYKNFKLVDTASADKWGRPGTTWTYNTGDKETFVADKAVVSYTTKVAECDIAKDLGISSAKKVELGYIDGEKFAATDAAVSTNRVATINPLATTSYVGAQGRLTEVYDMGSDGYRIVEINTYLAQVDKVTAAKTDRNGHTTDATVDLTVYLTNGTGVSFKGVEAEGFTVDQYVLVTVLKPNSYNKNGASVESIVAAEVVAGGKLTGWTNEVGTTAATSVVAGTTYNDANKFFLNHRVAGSSWLVALDSYGNAIGLVKSSSSYAAVARIEWKANTTSFGGYALADLVLADGTVQENVTVSSVNDKAVNAAGGDKATAGNKKTASVSIWWENNEEYYKHIVSYSVNGDGSYNLMDATHYTDNQAKNDKIIDLDSANYNNGSAALRGSDTTLVATDNTVFLYINENGYSYTVYVGKDKAPSITNADMCVKYDDNGYAELVVVRDYTDANNTFLAYVTDADRDGYAYPDNVQVNGYDVYKIGTTETTRVYDAMLDSNKKAMTNNKFATSYSTSGLYEIEVNADGWVIEMELVMADNGRTADLDVANDFTYVNYGFVKANPVGRSFEVVDEDGDAMIQYNVLDTTKVIKVLKYKNETILETSDISAITKDSTVLVTFEGLNAYKNQKADAETVYVISRENDVADVESYAIAQRVGSFSDSINLSTSSIDVNNYKVTKTVNGKTNNYNYGTATASAVIEALDGSYSTTVTWEVTDTGAASALVGNGSVSLLKGYYYKVTVTVSNDDFSVTMPAQTIAVQ